jgi:DNA polymerase-3 subunit gamma/tau
MAGDYPCTHRIGAMSYVVLARKYRPRKFAEMVGQEHVVQALTNALAQQRLHHAYLFTGTRGIGKTTVSRILAKSLNCTGADGRGGITAEPCGVCSACTEIDADRYMDYTELDAASNRSIDEIRDLIERAAYKPGVGRFKVFMIDEAHQLTKDAFNALLKTLEEPPEYLKFVLATTDPEKMLPTVLSRCLQFNLRPMAPQTVREHLARVLAAEAVPFDDGSLRLLARAARGSMRDGLSLTDQAIAYGGGQLSETAVRAMLGSVDRGQARALVAALAQRDGRGVLAAVDGLRTLGLSAAATLDAVALLLQQMAVQQVVPGALDAQEPEHEDACALAGALDADETQLLYSMVLHGREELTLMSDEYAALTMVLLRFLAFAEPGRAPKPDVRVDPDPASIVGAGAAAAARALPLRAAASPAISVPEPRTPVRAPAAAVAAPQGSGSATGAPSTGALVVAESAPLAFSELGDRWHALVKRLCEQGVLQALLRETAMQAGLRAIDESGTAPRWQLVVEREVLRTDALRDKLAAVLAAELGHAMALELVSGVPEDSPARRDAAERQRRQEAADAAIQSDVVVRALLSEFKSARIVPGSVKPV